MTDETLLTHLLEARQRREPCVLATVAAIKGSVPREPGAKALIFSDGRIHGTIGGGKFESLVITDAQSLLQTQKTPLLKTYPLHEKSPDSFGAICGGEVTVLLEPQLPREALIIFGAGHCGEALAKLARACGWHITVIDDRPDLLARCDAHQIHQGPAPDFINAHPWQPDEALVLVSRNYQLDRDALAAALKNPHFNAGYLGMIGSRKKVTSVFEELQSQGIPKTAFEKVHAPIGLDIQADTPTEIAISILAQIMSVLRKREA
ncbi:XdhC family protein [Phragmitibacter flavus]|uniref:XdhC family protein n=1 Tax=Phragmitibacter flavus TaxID=2576071 RepID=A0A5R8KKL1_9BACT|nr:XdhC family protein [Phragmitibacter flavus]TLD72149.1 XdhC family protein [Phragmitibacter flavus]